MWFSPSPDLLPSATVLHGLKAVPADTWKAMLDLVNCKVLSIVESEHVDAYLLSESSMFVFPHKLILKTCGTTTLLCGLPRILEIAALTVGFPHVVANPLKSIPAAATPYRVFYSRKNFLFPDQQRGPHRSWRDEVRYLDKMFLGGSAYMVGKMNGEHWYLYLTGPNTTLTPPATPEREKETGSNLETKVLTVPTETVVAQFNGHRMVSESVQDETLEVLMTDLEPDNAQQFYLDHASTVAEDQFFKQAHTAEGKGGTAVGASNESGMGNLGIQETRSQTHDSFDVFSNTSSENGEYATPVKHNVLPAELSTEGHALGTVVSKGCGLAEVYPESRYPDARIDAYLFTPCGFSANAVIPAPAGGQGTHYFTVHVTPEPHCSYASFETNVPGRQSGRETVEVVEQVVNIFKPGRFSVTLFEAKAHVVNGKGGDVAIEPAAVGPKTMETSAAKRSARMECIKGYRRIDRIVHDLDDYDLVFRYYERDDWKGGAPRLGEIGY